MSVFDKKAIPELVQREIQARTTEQGVLWAGQRFPFISLQSMSDKANPKYEFLGSRTSYQRVEDYYGLEGTWYAGRPEPVITNLSIKKQGELGTTRRATLTILAFTDEQLRELQKSFFIPGMTVRVQWGWNKPCIQSIGHPNIFFTVWSDVRALCEMKKESDRNPAYEGIQGKVANFSYTLDKENYWSCTLEIIAAAGTMAGVAVATYNCGCKAELKEKDPTTQESKDRIKKLSDFGKFLYDINYNFAPTLVNYVRELKTYGAKLPTPMIPVIVRRNYMGVRRTADGSPDAPWYEDFIPFQDYDTNETYISFATLLIALNKYAIPNTTGKNTTGRFVCDKSVLTSNKYIESSDPRVCLIPGSKYYDTISAPPTDFPAAVKPPVAKVSDTTVLLDNILVNTVHLLAELKSVEEGSNSMGDYMENILQKINFACGDLWEFAIVDNSVQSGCDGGNGDKGPSITIVDVKTASGEPSVFPIPAGGANSISAVRELSLEMKMTDSMKTQAVYATTPDQANDKDKCNKIAFKGFALNNGVFADKSNPAPSQAEINKWRDQNCKDLKEKNEPELPTIEEDLEEAFAEGMGPEFWGSDGVVDDSSTSSARSALIAAYNGRDKNAVPTQCQNVTLPMNLSFTLDGISGIQFGQIITCDRIPQELRNSYDFQITTVEHEVNVNDWTTKVTTVPRYKKK